MCDSLVARDGHSVDGATLFAKNSDRRGLEPQPFVQFPSAFHPRGSRVRCTHVEIDQVAETYRVMGHSPLWCWGFEQGVNEFGVAIGNHATWSREPLEEAPGLVGMDLVRLGLERGRDAREALEVIASLVETHGQGGPAFGPADPDGYQNSFMIADGSAAWLMETTQRGWAARRVDGAAGTNSLSLGTNWEIGSRDLERRALQQGFWTRDGRLDFKAAYAREDENSLFTQRREEASQRWLAGPPLSIETCKEWLRDHGAVPEPPSETLDSEDPDRYSVCMHAEPIGTTTASIAARLPVEATERPWPVWISFATPCTGLFLPVYLDGVLPVEIAWGGELRADGSPESESARSSLWWAMRSLQEKAAADFGRSTPRLRDEWRALEASIEAERIDLEEAVAVLYADDRAEVGARMLTRFMAETAKRVLDEVGRLSASI